MTDHTENLKEAYAILAGIPNTNFVQDLWRFYDTPVKRDGDLPLPSCSTIACGAGWLALHPKFQTGKLDKMHAMDWRGWSKKYFGEDTFGLIFSPKRGSSFDDQISFNMVSSKQLLLYRIRRQLGQEPHAALTAAIHDSVFRGQNV